GGGAERIQAENGNPFGGSNSFSFLFLGRKRSAQQQIDKIHGSILPQILHTTMASNWYPIGVDWLGTRNGDGLVASLIYGLRRTGRRALDRHSIRPRRRHVGLWRGGGPKRNSSGKNIPFCPGGGLN